MSGDQGHDNLDWSRYAVFLRKARLAAHQCLYFLYHVDQRSAPSAASIELALRQAHAVVGGIHVPSAYKDRLPAALETDAYVAGAREVIDCWIELRQQLRGSQGDATPARVDQITQQLQAFLAASARKQLLARVTGSLTNLRVYLTKNICLILGVAVSLAACFGIEAVRSLLLNEGWYALAMAAIVLASWLVLVASNRVNHIGVGHEAFWAYRFQAYEPERDLERWSALPAGAAKRAGWQALLSSLPDKILAAMLVKTLLVVLWLSLCGVVVANVGQQTRLTVITILGLLFVSCLMGHWIDRWDFLDPRPIRLSALLLLPVVVATLFLEHRVVTTLLLVAAIAYCIMRLVQRRALLTGAPVFLLGLFWVSNALSGIMQAGPAWQEPSLITAARSLETSTAAATQPEPATSQPKSGVHIGAEDWPFPGRTASDALYKQGKRLDPVVIVTASGGGSRAAIFTALSLEYLQKDQALRVIADNIHAISSVSGGSLATAAYVTRAYEAHRSQQPIDIGSLVGAVSQDFLWPTLVGALLPGTNRALEIERAWQAKSGPALGDIGLRDLSAQWSKAIENGEHKPPFPLPIFNTTSLDQHDVIVSPLPSAVFQGKKPTNREQARSIYKLGDRDTLTWVYDRDGIYGLDALVGDFDPGLAAAVRASANFPFGFPLVDIESTQDRLYLDPTYTDNTKALASLKLTDGGVLSNSGAWPLYHLIASDKNRLDELRRRGVLLIVIEASKMPEFSQGARDLITLYGALGNRAPVAQAYHRRLFELLNEKLDSHFAVVQLDMIPKSREESYNVQTTWALDDRSLKKVRESFDLAWKPLKEPIAASMATRPTEPRLLSYWHALARGEPVGLADLPRPPLD